ncbi:MAG: apolipoprotein N-acyltransferase [Proteobacteria bacterium]|nr:apolipoprotein N-acyltransferase [Pseudomonadota bacterium]
MRLDDRRLFWVVWVVLCGALLPLSLSPIDWWPLAFVSIGGWFYALHRGVLPAWLSGWLYGAGKYAVGVSWVYGSIHEFGEETVLVSGLLVALFVAGLSLFSMVQAWMFKLASSTSLVRNAFSFVAVWVVAEWLLTWFLTGFPWLLPGYAVIDTTLVNFAPVAGVLLVSAIVVLIACSAVVVLAGPQRIRFATLVVGPWLVALSLGQIEWVQPVETRTAALVQGNVAQGSKWDFENRQPIVRRYLKLSDPHWDVDVLVWPEAAITYFEHEATALLDELDRRGRQTGAALVMGIASVEFLPGGDYTMHNTAISLGAGASRNNRSRYIKRHLVPFGEYVPLQDMLRGLISFFDLPMSATQPGPMHQPPLVIGDLKAAMAICYEVVYSEMMRAPARESDVLITVTNDTWFGTSIGPWQHMQMARMRAVENGRWLLRGTNNGVSVIVDHHGQISHTMPQFEEGVLRGDFQVMQGSTLFNRFGHGWLVALSLLGWGLAGVIQRVRRVHSR